MVSSSCQKRIPTFQRNQKKGGTESIRSKEGPASASNERDRTGGGRYAVQLKERLMVIRTDSSKPVLYRHDGKEVDPERGLIDTRWLNYYYWLLKKRQGNCRGVELRMESQLQDGESD